MKLVTVSEMKAIEAAANENGLSYDQMMENAGNGLADVVISSYSQEDPGNIMGLIGPGNNGGDTLIALAALQNHGWQASGYLSKPRKENDFALQIAKAAGIEVFTQVEDPKYEKLRAAIEQADLVLDGLLGTGIKLPLKAEIAQVLSTAQEIISSLDEPPVVIAVDCPSGVDSDTGQAAAETIPADLTVCMAAVKMGLLAFPALGLVGEMTCVDIGLTNKVPEWTGTRRSVVDAEMVQEALPARKMDAHKGTYGTALLVVGSVNFTGAAYLSAEAAYRVGTGLVTLATPSPLHQALAGQIPEATWLLLPHELGVISESAVDVVREQTEKAEALLLGPGWGMEETTQFFLERLLQVKDAPAPHAIGFVRSQRSGIESPNNQLPPRVIDADGLKLLAKIKDWPTYLNEQTVLTPHPGEMAVLTGQQIRDIQVDRIQIAEKYAREWKKVVVLKGAATVIANPDGRSAVVPIATSALAKGGTGDVLAGMITGLLAQGMEAYPAAYCGAWLHAQAGLSALEEIGNPASVLAGDVALAIPEVFNQLGIVDRL